jgi:Fe-S-cluster containining protein
MLRFAVETEEHPITFRSLSQFNLDAFNERMRPHQPGYHKRINAIVQSRAPVRVRLRQLHALLDEVTAHVGENAACKRGCSHCCHIPVGVLEPEAAMLGAAINVKPKRPKKWRSGFADVKSGYDNPCTFLVDNECTIYEHRPIACRIHYNMDADADMCRLDEIRNGVPYLNLKMFNEAAVLICQTRHLGDIREFFPRRTA